MTRSAALPSRAARTRWRPTNSSNGPFNEDSPAFVIAQASFVDLHGRTDGVRWPLRAAPKRVRAPCSPTKSRASGATVGGPIGVTAGRAVDCGTGAFVDAAIRL